MDWRWAFRQIASPKTGATEITSSFSFSVSSTFGTVSVVTILEICGKSINLSRAFPVNTPWVQMTAISSIPYFTSRLLTSRMVEPVAISSS